MALVPENLNLKAIFQWKLYVNDVQPMSINNHNNHTHIHKENMTIMLTTNIIYNVLTNGSVGTVTTRGASLMYSSMVVRKDCGGWKGQQCNNGNKLRMK